MYPRTQNSHPIAHWNSSSTPINHTSIHPKGPSHPLKPTYQDLPICIKRMASYVLPACPILDGFICLILLSHACRRKCTSALRDRSLYPRFNPRSAKRHRRRSALFHIRWISTTNDCSHRLVNKRHNLRCIPPNLVQFDDLKPNRGVWRLHMSPIHCLEITVVPTSNASNGPKCSA